MQLFLVSVSVSLAFVVLLSCCQSIINHEFRFELLSACMGDVHICFISYAVCDLFIFGYDTRLLRFYETSS